LAIIVSKKELLETLPTVKKTVPTRPLSNLEKANQLLKTVDMLLKNQFVQGTLNRVLNRFGIQPLQQQPTSLDAKVEKKVEPLKKKLQKEIDKETKVNNPNPFDANEIYNTIVKTVETVLSLKGDMPLSELKTQMEINKEALIELIKNAVNKPKS